MIQIGCTQKMQEFLNIEHLSPPPDIDPFFSWSASLLTVRRHKVLILVNNASRACAILFGVTAKMKRKLDALIIEAIRRTLQTECIAPDLISRYIHACGDKISCTKNRNRSAVSSLNHAAANLEMYENPWITDEPYQPMAVRWCNSKRIMNKDTGQYETIRHQLYRAFADHYRRPNPCRCDMAILEIQVSGTDCIRKIRMPSFFSLWTLHLIIRRIFARDEKHVHEFSSDNDDPIDILFPEYGDFEARKSIEDSFRQIESHVDLKEAFQQNKNLIYTDDCGLDQEFRIHLTDIEKQSDDTHPRCLLAAGTPPIRTIDIEKALIEFLFTANDSSDTQNIDLFKPGGRTTSIPTDIKDIDILLNQY